MATPNWALPQPAGTDLANTLDTIITSLSDTLDNATDSVTKLRKGVFASRPSAATAKSGCFYWATDISTMFLSDGTNWQTIDLSSTSATALGVTQGSTIRRGKSIIAAEETITNAAFTFMPTADRVQGIVQPTDGLLAITYKALWKAPASVAAEAAIFIGANQLKNGAPNGVPVVQSALSAVDATPNYNHLISILLGVGSEAGTASDSSDVTTGQTFSTVSGQAGVCYIFAAAGTYDVGVKFRSASGTVSAKERKLWAWTIGF